MFVVCVFGGWVGGVDVVVWPRWTMDIVLDSAVVEHRTSDAGVLGSIPGPAIYFHMYFFV